MGKANTTSAESAPPATSTRTLRKALGDLVDGLGQRRVWSHLGWQDIKQRYRRSTIGPLWITMSLGLTVAVLGFLFSELFDVPPREQVPYLAVGWVALLFGVIATRFRDIDPIIANVATLLFYVTPIVWDAQLLRDRAVDWRANLADWNPLYHYIEIVRDPLLGAEQSLSHWLVVLGCTAVGWTFALLVLRNYRARVPYWV